MRDRQKKEEKYFTETRALYRLVFRGKKRKERKKK